MEPGSAGLKGGKDGVNQQGIDNFEKKLQDQTNELNKLDPNVSELFEFQIGRCSVDCRSQKAFACF